MTICVVMTLFSAYFFRHVFIYFICVTLFIVASGISSMHQKRFFFCISFFFLYLFIYLFIFGGIFLDKSVPYLILCHGTPYVVIYTPNPFFKKGLSIDTTTILIRCTLGIKITIKNILKMITLVAEWPP